VVFITDEIDDADALRDHAERALAYMKTKRNGGFLVVCEDMMSRHIREQTAALRSPVWQPPN